MRGERIILRGEELKIEVVGEVTEVGTEVGNPGDIMITKGLNHIRLRELIMTKNINFRTRKDNKTQGHSIINKKDLIIKTIEKGENHTMMTMIRREALPMREEEEAGASVVYVGVLEAE